MASNSTASKCLMCTQPSTLRCADCKAVSYCSLEIPQGALLELQGLSDSSGQEHVVYLMPDESNPKFCWLDKADFLDKLRGGEGNMYDLIPGAELVQESRVEVNQISGQRQERKLTMYYDENILRYAQLNKAVVSSTQGLLAYDWKGPILACAGKLGSSDFNMVDFHHLVAFFITYRGKVEINEWLSGPKLKAVLIPCDGETRLDATASPRGVVVPRLHYIWDEQDDISAVSQRIGMPLFAVHCLTKSPKWTESRDLINFATVMHINGVPNPKFNGKKVDFWARSKVGNMLVARVDRQPLEPDVAQAFADYCKYHVGALAGAGMLQDPDAMMSDLHNPTKDPPAFVLAEMTPEKWAIYLSQWKALKAHDNAVAANAKAGNASAVPVDGVTSDTIDGVPRMGLTKQDSFRLTRKVNPDLRSMLSSLHI
ncbi:hypothetical protein TI39_contig4305g00006 [Zymoseptoria brevis]|uniref:Uncharacterized protein n=1 Tax=Zymoseptoria brevis TaxID=1047168 RepID=A0A0F4G815_9PEZI|nr:hypothetical protein TI39_contig4305g00006 [Zymoseptoria brevis]